MCPEGAALAFSYRTYEKGWFLFDPTDSLGMELSLAGELDPKADGPLDVRRSQSGCWARAVPDQ